MKNEAFQGFIRHLTAYAEFYADTVTVFYFKDKSAMFKALYYDAMTDFQFQCLREAFEKGRSLSQGEGVDQE